MARVRSVALVVVVAIHVGLVTVLIVASRIRLRSPATRDFLTTLALLPKPLSPAPRPLAPAPQIHLAPVAPLTSLPPPTPSITYPSMDDSSAPIDWKAEAQKAAAAITSSKPVAPDPKDRRKTSSSPGPRPWFPPSAHHAGEQYKTITGDSIVWISDKCYVKSSAPLLGVPDLFARGMLSGTVCPGDSGTARGDLFEALPAYKKLHPEAGEK